MKGLKVGGWAAEQSDYGRPPDSHNAPRESTKLRRTSSQSQQVASGVHQNDTALAPSCQSFYLVYSMYTTGSIDIWHLSVRFRADSGIRFSRRAQRTDTVWQKSPCFRSGGSIWGIMVPVKVLWCQRTCSRSELTCSGYAGCKKSLKTNISESLWDK